MKHNEPGQQHISRKYELYAWQPIPLQESAENILRRFQDTENENPRDGKASGRVQEEARRWVVTTGIRPVDLYVYLKSRFGEPNGHLMIVKNDDSDNLFHWHYAMATPLGTLEFICWTFRLEIFHPFNPVDSDAHEFLQCIKNDFQNHAQRMGEIRKSLEHWHMFLNPYRRLKSMIEDNLQEIVDLHIEDIVDPVHPTNLGRLWKTQPICGTMAL